MATMIIKQGDITKEEVDAIVNAANSSLQGGGGVDGAIHMRGGPAIMQECNEIRKREGGCKTGYAVITGAGNLNARFVIHAVGPIWQGGNHGEERLLKEAYLTSLKLAAEAGATSIAFPSISTGAYRFPIEKAAKIALETVKQFCLEDKRIQEVRFILFSSSDLAVYSKFIGP